MEVAQYPFCMGNVNKCRRGWSMLGAEIPIYLDGESNPCTEYLLEE